MKTNVAIGSLHNKRGKVRRALEKVIGGLEENEEIIVTRLYLSNETAEDACDDIDDLIYWIDYCLNDNEDDDLAAIYVNGNDIVQIDYD